jgi:HD-GYP domain-containing protein (c-di-GMP phosphodiesterase class II)
LPVNKFKVAMGGLLHDAGQKDIDLAILMKPKASWTYEETKKYESHPLRSMEILNNMKYIPSDVIHIVKEHHEDGLAQGFPSRLRKSACHPMGKLVAVANEFCNRIITNPHYQKMSPQDAITQMVSFNAERLDPAFLGALMKLFNMTPLEDPTKKKARFS